MTLRLILGRAGSGKTRRCLEEISRQLDRSPAGPPLILLVPEQATFQMERALVQAARCRGSIRAQVLSFRRLAWRVLAEAGGAARPHLSELGRQMILRRVLEQRQGDLKVFQKPAQQPGFDQTLSRLLSELKSCCITPDQLRAAAPDQLAALAHLVEKLQDLSLIYSEAENYLQGRYTDPDDYLKLLAERLPRSALVRGAQFWLDGFTGFTAQEYAVVGQLMAAADRVQVTLCLGGEDLFSPLDELELFYPTRETGQRLLQLAARLGVETENPLVLNDAVPWRFRRRPELAHLESQFFQRPAAVFGRPPEGLRLVAGANRRAEVEAVAREMTRLAQDRGLRWREMAVLLRDLEGYQELITAVFTDHQIPFFLDRKREAHHHPLVELVSAAFETIIRGWTYDPLFRYLKTDLVPVARDEVDQLENLALARGIQGKSWLEEWEDPGCRFQTAELNQARRRAVSALARFQEALGGKPDLRRVAAALIDLLFQLEVPQQLAGWVERDQSAGRLEAAQEHPQVWQGVVDLLEQLVDSLGDEVLPLEQVARIVEAGLEGLRLGLIPPALDQVLVGTLDRSRHPEVRAAFL
ncbi:MAG: exodeoxyribonuclease V subunit gamma, partial [Syntrophomonadaceae bacterium]|nr:exodeoxyribonuclease V subunit gamma [Syntrophomonadaceae bacterium]